MNEFVVGLDLGQSQDFTAVAVLRSAPALDQTGKPVSGQNSRGAQVFDVVHLERFPLGTPYPAIVGKVKDLVGRKELQEGGEPRLAIDASGVGRAVVDMVVDADLPAVVSPITITAGNGDYRRDCWHGHHGPWAFWVAKIHIVGSVQAALSTGRLRIGSKLPFADILKKELINYRVKLTPAANEVFDPRSGTHDDLLLATAIAVWLGSEPHFPDYSLGELIGIPMPRRRLPGRPSGSPDDDWHRRAAEAEVTQQRLEERHRAAAAAPPTPPTWPASRAKPVEPEEDEDVWPRRRRIRNFYGRR
jgi:hypothetical protein